MHQLWRDARFGFRMLILAVAGLLANFIPARHVTKIDPVVALSAE